MKNLVILSTLLVVLNACNNNPSEVNNVLKYSGDNKSELQSVIYHYKQEGNVDKINAAYFLIGNMKDKFSYDGESVTEFDPIFTILDSLYLRKVKMLTESPIIKAKWDSLTDIYGPPNVPKSQRVQDYSAITSAMLIENIDLSYQLWKSNGWNKKISFKQYCEYLLPYRVGTERMSPWMQYLHQEYKPFMDTVQFKNQFQLAKKLDILLRKRIGLNHTIDKYPFDMTAKQMEQARRGACRHLVNYEAMVMRACGIPVSLEFTPYWGDLSKGHQWLALIDAKKKPFAFNAVQEDFEGFGKTPYRVSKVYRKSFAKQNILHPKNDEDIPLGLFDDYVLDVTAEYTRTSNLNMELQYPSKFKNQHAIICTYGDDWVPQGWSKIKNNKVEFKNMGTNLVYVVMYYHQKKLYPATLPFICDKDGKQFFIKPSQQKQSVNLERKYPYFNLNYRNAVCFLNGRLQGANKIGFEDAVDLYTVKEVPTKYMDIVLKHPQKFRYARYIAATGQKTNLAELEFYTTGKKSKDTTRIIGKTMGAPELSKDLGTGYQNAFDNKPETYFSGDKDSISWTGMGFGKPTAIAKIRYCPRSDTNFILIGDTYELFFWQTDHWLSLGKQVATRQTITYGNVPSNGLYLLHDISHGNEQRIFTYEQHKQVWW